MPVHPELTRILRDHLVQFGTAPEGRLFIGALGGELPTNTRRRAWIKARQTALTKAEQASPLARRPYHLRHACLSTWLNGGVYPTQVAEWAGHSVDVLLRIYAKCMWARTSKLSAGLAKPCARPNLGTYWAQRPAYLYSRPHTAAHCGDGARSRDSGITAVHQPRTRTF